MYTDNPVWHKYNLRYNNLLKAQSTGMYPYEYEYIWRQKQTERLLNNKKHYKAFSQSIPILNRKGVVLPAINPYRLPELAALPVAQQTLAAAKLEIDGKLFTCESLTLFV